MTALARPRPLRRVPHGLAPWLAAGVAAGALLGAATAIHPLLGVGVLALPGIGWLFLRPQLLPSLLIVTVFAESLELGGLTISRLSGPLAAAIVVAYLVTRGLPSFPRREVLWAVTAYTAWALLSAIWTVNPDDSFQESGTDFALASLVLSLVYMASFAILIETRRDLRRLAITVWFVAVALGIVAIGQYFAGFERAVAYAGDANFFAALQVLALPVCLVVASHTERGGLRLIALLGVAIVVGSVLVSLSRGGLLALLGVLALIAFQPARVMFRSPGAKRLALLAVVLGGGALMFAAFSDLEARSESLFTTTEGGSGRANLWRAAMTGWEEHPVRGMGYGSFPNESTRLLRQTPGVDFSAYRLRRGGQVAHSAYLGTLAELGVIGLALFLTMLGSVLVTLRWVARTARARPDPIVAAAAQALLVAIAGFLLVSAFLTTETDRGIWVLMGVTLALARIAASPAKMPQASE